MDAKNNFREGYILLQRSFKFAEMEFGIPKFSILYAYIERPLFEDEINERGQSSLEEIDASRSFMGGNYKFKKGIYEKEEDYNKRISEEYDFILKDPKNFNKIHIGNMVQTTIDGVNCSFFPDEYKVIEFETLSESIYGDEYLMITPDEKIFNMPEMQNKIFYLQSRGISKKKAQKLSSFGLKDLVMYFPHPELQKMFCRSHEVVYIPEYEEYYKHVYGGFEEYRKTC